MSPSNLLLELLESVFGTNKSKPSSNYNANSDKDIHGNDTNRDVHGNRTDRDVHGNRTDRDGWGNDPKDSYGNPK